MFPLPLSQPGSARTKSTRPSARRAEATKIYPPEQTIRSIKACHRQVYAIRPITARSSRFCPAIRGTNARSRLFSRKFRPLARTICFVATTIRRPAPSQAQPAFADINRLIINCKENTATESAALIIPAVGNNKLRHEPLQNFILVNDSSTIAVEIPIGVPRGQISELETR